MRVLRREGGIEERREFRFLSFSRKGGVEWWKRLRFRSFFEREKKRKRCDSYPRDGKFSLKNVGDKIKGMVMINYVDRNKWNIKCDVRS